jgi:hypothetical protein
MENELFHLLLVIVICIFSIFAMLGICYYANKKADENPWYMLVPVGIMLCLYVALRFVH